MDQWENTEYSVECEDRLVLEIVCFTSNRVREKALSPDKATKIELDTHLILK